MDRLVEKINLLLEKRYGCGACPSGRRSLPEGDTKIQRGRRDALDELVLTILSQNTSDVNSGKAFESLKRNFRSWKALEAAPPRRIANAIRAGGLANIKAARIKGALRCL